MELKKSLHFAVYRDNFMFRSLHEDDVSENYVAALNSEQTYLLNNPADLDVKWQREYVRRIRLSRFNAVCGLFAKSCLVGTAGIQSISWGGEDTTFGIFVLDKESRGKGYGKMLVWATCCLLNELFEISRFGAGAETSNAPSVRSFISCGFVVVASKQDKSRMEMNFMNLKKPEFISSIVII